MDRWVCTAACPPQVLPLIVSQSLGDFPVCFEWRMLIIYISMLIYLDDNAHHCGPGAIVVLNLRYRSKEMGASEVVILLLMLQ